LGHAEWELEIDVGKPAALIAVAHDASPAADDGAVVTAPLAVVAAIERRIIAVGVR
jgi:hypothetical protein